MKITAVEAIPLALPYRHDGAPTGFGGTVWTKLAHILVRVETAQGLVGWGEAFGYGVGKATVSVLRDVVAPLAIGRDAGDVAGLTEHLQKTLHIYGRGGPTQFALSGLNIALWDLAGKRSGKSVAQLLGGVHRDRVEAYTSLLRISDPDVVAKACARARSRGFKALKLHEVTEPAVAAARDALGSGFPLMLDVNCAWSLEGAREMAPALAPHDLAWLEEPVWPPEDLAALEQLAEGSTIPLAAGENIPNGSAFVPYAASSALAYLQPSVTKVGGLTEVARVVAMAQGRGCRIAMHSPYFGPGLLATLQLAAFTPLIDRIECFGVELEQPLFGETGLPDRDGIFAIPAAPGLGADPDPDAIARLRADA